MFLVFLFRTYNFFISDNNTPNIHLLRISTHMKYFCFSNVVCNGNKHDIDDKSRKRKINELNEKESIELNKEELNVEEFNENNREYYEEEFNKLYKKFNIEEFNEELFNKLYKELNEFNDFNEELIETPDIKIHNEIDFSIYSCFSPETESNFENSDKYNQLEDLDLSNPSFFLPESEVHSQNFLESNQSEKVYIESNNTEKDINYFFEKILKLLDKNKQKYLTKLIYNRINSEFIKMIEYYENNKNKIYEKELIVKIEIIIKKIIKKCLSIEYSENDLYHSLFKKIYESYSKALDIKCNKIRSLHEILSDINFEDDISKNKKDIIMNLKDILTNTKDFNEIEENIKKIFKEDKNKKYFMSFRFFKFLFTFFNKKEIFLLRLIRGTYKSGKHSYNYFLKDDILKIEDIMDIIKSYEDYKLFFVFRNVSCSCLNIILKKFCEEGIKKFEIFTIYMNYMSTNHYDIIYNISYKIDKKFINSNYNILSAHIYCINFNIRYFQSWYEYFTMRISKIRKEDTNFNEKFQEYRNHFDNKEGILQYLNEDQYLILKEY